MERHGNLSIPNSHIGRSWLEVPRTSVEGSSLLIVQESGQTTPVEVGSEHPNGYVQVVHTPPPSDSPDCCTIMSHHPLKISHACNFQRSSHVHGSPISTFFTKFSTSIVLTPKECRILFSGKVLALLLQQGYDPPKTELQI